ncbi:MAG: ion transporter [Cyclobacteriaceae bacterium]
MKREEQKEIRFRYLHQLRLRLHIIIFGTDTRAGKLFDVVLLYAILLSIIVVMLESVREINEQYDTLLSGLEWAFTIFFSIEYLLRLFCSFRPRKYAFSFLGIIDLLAILPTYLTIFAPGVQFLVVIRSVRLLRVFRVLQMSNYMGEATLLGQALINSQRKIIVFLGVVLSIVVISGTLMYIIEGPSNGFKSIPLSIYWAVVTLTTVGYGDIAPQTIVGQTFSVILMLLGYAIIAVPTGIVTSEITHTNRDDKEKDELECSLCLTKGHDRDAVFCKFCGAKFVGE